MCRALADESAANRMPGPGANFLSDIRVPLPILFGQSKTTLLKKRAGQLNPPHEGSHFPKAEPGSKADCC